MIMKEISGKEYSSNWKIKKPSKKDCKDQPALGQKDWYLPVDTEGIGDNIWLQ